MWRLVDAGIVYKLKRLWLKRQIFVLVPISCETFKSRRDVIS